MSISEFLKKKWMNNTSAFLIKDSDEVFFSDIEAINTDYLHPIESGDVVALIGDFDAHSIAALFFLFDLKTIVVPLTKLTQIEHEYFFESAKVQWIVQDNELKKISEKNSDPLLSILRESNDPGLILFSTGSTGKPKAVLHNFRTFIERFYTTRPATRTLAFLLFDHIGGLNTLFHTLFNEGTVISTSDRSIENVLKICRENRVETLPTTPTFLRMMLISGYINDSFPSDINLITYGTERMDEQTLIQISALLPNVDFRQTYGLSELGIMRIKSHSRSSLFMKIGGEGFEYKILDNELWILAKNRMLGYLNADSPFDENGWYNTHDLVEMNSSGEIRIIGRNSDLVNVGGLKFRIEEVERVALSFQGILFAKGLKVANPFTGEHVELLVEPKSQDSFDLEDFKKFLSRNLVNHMIPRRVRVGGVKIGHRFKQI
jgi:long-chain acyl-CoA synthetase